MGATLSPNSTPGPSLLPSVLQSTASLGPRQGRGLPPATEIAGAWDSWNARLPWRGILSLCENIPKLKVLPHLGQFNQ